MTFIELGIKLGFSFLASAVALVVWAKNREAAWSWIVLGVLLNYVDLMLQFLTILGLFEENWLRFGDYKAIGWLPSILSNLAFVVGFIYLLKEIQKFEVLEKVDKRKKKS